VSSSTIAATPVSSGDLGGGLSGLKPVYAAALGNKGTIFEGGGLCIQAQVAVQGNVARVQLRYCNTSGMCLCLCVYLCVYVSVSVSLESCGIATLVVCVYVSMSISVSMSLERCGTATHVVCLASRVCLASVDAHDILTSRLTACKVLRNECVLTAWSSWCAGAAFEGFKTMVQQITQTQAVAQDLSANVIAPGGVLEQLVQVKANDYFGEPPKLAVAYSTQGAQKQVYSSILLVSPLPSFSCLLFRCLPLSHPLLCVCVCVCFA
jgi:hypothetical protein